MSVTVAPVSLRVKGRTPARAAVGVHISGLTFGYRRKIPVVNDVSTVFDAGLVHCLLGDSGCGKTTLLRLIAGLERPSSGEIRVGDDVVEGRGKHLSPERRPVGFVFQDYALFPHLSVIRNVMFGMKGRRSVRKAEAAQFIEKVGMAGFEYAMPHTLSGGQQQRIAIARALARRPKVMLLDEPFSGLDAVLRESVRDQTLDLLREAGVTTIMVTHNPREALVSADTVSVMRAGRIAMTGKPSDVCICATDSRGHSVIQLCREATDAGCGLTPTYV